MHIMGLLEIGFESRCWYYRETIYIKIIETASSPFCLQGSPKTIKMSMEIQLSI